MAETPLIQTPEEVEALAVALSEEPTLAVDTEADSFFHYVDKLCLIQIGYGGGKVALIDPLSLPPGGLHPLESVLADPKICKIFHAADYDLYVLQRYGGFKLRNLFDTMISAQLLGYRALGLAALVKQHFGVELSKDQQRTDWSRRPLRPAQLEYAASDVRYLIELAEVLRGELTGKGRLAWAQGEFLGLEERSWPEREFDPDGYLRIKGARQLPPEGRAVLRELYRMRDEHARTRDRPAFKILGNGTLLDLASEPPQSRRGLSGRKGLSELVVRRLGRDILDAVKRGLESPEPVRPPSPRHSGPPRRRLDRRADARLEQLKAWRARRAHELDLDPGVFCPNALLEEVAFSEPSSLEDLARMNSSKPWWCEAFGAELLALAQTEPAAPAASREREHRSRRPPRESESPD
jgi:ribonuclease D